MNKKKLSYIVIMIVIAVIAIVNVSVNMEKNTHSSLSLTELEALAGEHVWDASSKACFLLAGGYVEWICYTGGSMYCYQRSYEGPCY
jgi:hypothetical protein